ncbi:unnamed protein product [Protopolystoma xenopodis]|uniref:Uncharacterized protein n=1 Tax=Protopolystoma xenopodis TaxID=117903 RepID=A0A448WG21_9PLAT|nr:unnamed protein product [Protopolystoma xenopodis]
MSLASRYQLLLVNQLHLPPRLALFCSLNEMAGRVASASSKEWAMNFNSKSSLGLNSSDFFLAIGLFEFPVSETSLNEIVGRVASILTM